MQDRVEELTAEEESEINLTPMLDVVFIMLIFFIVTAVFVREPGQEVAPPAAVTVDPAKGSIFVAITANDQIWVDRRQVGVDGARAAIERLHSENPDSGVIIQADKQAHNQMLISVMDAAKQAGVGDIMIAAEPE